MDSETLGAFVTLGFWSVTVAINVYREGFLRRVLLCLIVWMVVVKYPFFEDKCLRKLGQHKRLAAS